MSSQKTPNQPNTPDEHSGLQQPTTPPVPQYAQPVQQSYYPPQRTSTPGQWQGIASIIMGASFLGIIGIPLGIISIVKAKESGGTDAKALGVVGLVLSVVTLLISIVVTIGMVLYLKEIELNRGRSSGTSISRSISLDEDYTPSVGVPVWRFSDDKMPTGWEETDNTSGVHTYSDGLGSEVKTRSASLKETYTGQTDREDSKQLIKDSVKNFAKTVPSSEVLYTEWEETSVERLNDGMQIKMMCGRTVYKNELILACARVYDNKKVFQYVYTSDTGRMTSSGQAFLAKLSIREKLDANSYSQ